MQSKHLEARMETNGLSLLASTHSLPSSIDHLAKPISMDQMVKPTSFDHVIKLMVSTRTSDDCA